MLIYKIREFITYWKIACKLLNQNDPNTLLLDSSDITQLDLSLGRWTRFKHVFVPSFTVKMDADNESLLLQYCLRLAFKNRTKGIVGSYRPNGLDNLEATKLAIEIVKDCHFSGTLLTDKLKSLMEAE